MVNEVSKSMTIEYLENEDVSLGPRHDSADNDFQPQSTVFYLMALRVNRSTNIDFFCFALCI